MPRYISRAIIIAVLFLLALAGCQGQDSQDVFANADGEMPAHGSPSEDIDESENNADSTPVDPTPSPASTGSAAENNPSPTPAQTSADGGSPTITLSTGTPVNDYLSQPPIQYALPAAAPEVRGLYVTGNHAGIPSLFEKHLATTLETGMNAMVIDVRTEDKITMKNWIPMADEWGISENSIPDINLVMQTLLDNDIYPIARVVVFKDLYTVKHRPDLYIHNKDGTIWLDSSNKARGNPWLNPYNREAWDYVLTYAKAAAELGFKEIQFDYVRFPATESRFELADFGDIGDTTRTEIIEEFIKYAMEQLRPYNVKVSADVYGTIMNSNVDARIVGQDYTALARLLDVICPMVYPSHFANGTYGLAHPDLDPYNTIYQAMLKSAERLSAIPEGEHRAIVRPWLQSFTASYMPSGSWKPYTAKERAEQVQAVYDAGLTEWLFWDAGNKYTQEDFSLITMPHTE